MTQIVKKMMNKSIDFETQNLRLVEVNVGKSKRKLRKEKVS